MYNGKIILRKTEKNRLNASKEVNNMLRQKMEGLCLNAHVLNVV